ncbi:MAG TPA: hypothetical protein VKN99_01785 [Polyangia bacterium]|nr:hypothetical protein [Polyangia bacterium]
MRFERPDFVEIKMDAEVSAYQGDEGEGSRPPLVRPPGPETADDAQAQPPGSA